MEYNFLKREVYMPEKYFKKDRHVKLGKTENTFFAVLWFSKDNLASYEQLFEKTYELRDFDVKLLRGMANKLRKKGIKIVPFYKLGYQLKEK